MKRQIKLGLICLIIGISIYSCGKDIEGPNSLPPGTIGPTGTTGTTVEQGSLMMYLIWQEYQTYCDSIEVIVDDTTRGFLTTVFSGIDPDCDVAGAVTIDSLSPGIHKIYVGDCDFVFWEMDKIVLKDQCIKVPISN